VVPHIVLPTGRLLPTVKNLLGTVDQLTIKSLEQLIGGKFLVGAKADLELWDIL
jgi:hypothetical protein